MIAIAAIIVVLFFQFYFGWTKKGETLLSALVNISPHIGIFLAYTLRHLIKTPWLLDADRQSEIDSVTKDLASVNAQVTSMASELTRPKFTLKKPSLNPVGEFDEDDRFSFNFVLENIGSRSAMGMVSRIVLAEEGTNEQAKAVDNSTANEIPINEPLDMELGMRVSANQPPLYIVFALRYKDAVTERLYRQLFFLKWPGRKFGEIVSEIHHLTIEERELVQERLKDHLSEFIYDGVDLSEKAGSIPSSKID